MDEKGFMMGLALHCKVICKKGSRLVKKTQDGPREWVTVIEAVSGDGWVLHRMIINKGKAHCMGWYAKLKRDDVATFGVLEKGWSNEDLGLWWVREIFDIETWARQVFSIRLLLYIGLLILMCSNWLIGREISTGYLYLMATPPTLIESFLIFV